MFICPKCQKEIVLDHRFKIINDGKLEHVDCFKSNGVKVTGDKFTLADGTTYNRPTGGKH